MSFKDHTVGQPFQELVAFEHQRHDNSDTTSSLDNDQLEGLTPVKHNIDSNLHTDRQGVMNSIGVVCHEEFCKDRWEKSFHVLSEFFNDHGRACEPDKNSALGLWTAHQRNLHSSGLLHPDLVHDLEEIGFSWTPSDCFVDGVKPWSTTISRDSVEKRTSAETWSAKFAALVRHREILGHCLVSTSYDASLRSWVHVQRRRQSEGSLPNCEEEQLNSIGFAWKDGYKPFVEQTWEHMYIRLKAFREDHGHCVVNSFNCVDEDLIVWANTQLEQGCSRPDQVAKLDSLGFAWKLTRNTIMKEPKSREIVDKASSRGCFHHESSEEKWNAKYELAVKHHQQFGHTFVNKRTCTLYRWVLWQRKLHLEGTLCNCREERLNNILSEWSEVFRTPEQRWDIMYERLKAYHEEHGTCRVSRETSNYRQLQHWVYGQRVKIIRGSMMPDQKAKLDLLGCFRKTDKGNVLHPEGNVDNPNSMGFASNQGRPLSRDERWEVMYKRLKAYKEKHGHCRVRNSEGSNELQLKIWLTRQRIARRRTYRPDRMAKLNLLGIFLNEDGNPGARSCCGGQSRGTKRGAEHLEADIEDESATVEVDDRKATTALVEHSSRGKLIRGNLCEEATGGSRRRDACLLEKATVEYAAADDTFRQIQEDRPGTLGFLSTPPAIELQDRQEPCGLATSRPSKLASRDERWNKKYQELVQYYQMFGHSSVRMNDDALLYFWCCRQRLSLRQGLLPQSRVEKLETMKFPLYQDRPSRDEQWEAMYTRLKEYLEEHGSLPCMRVNNKNHNQLVRWIRAQRSEDRVDRRPDREAKLELLGVRWKSQKDNDDVLPHSSMNLRMNKQKARQSENAGKGTEVHKALDTPVRSRRNARRRVIYLCENTETVSSMQRVRPTTRKPRTSRNPARANLNIVIKEKLDSTKGGEETSEEEPSTMVGSNLASNHIIGKAGSDDCLCTKECIPKLIDYESLMKGRGEALRTVQSELETSNNVRERQRLLKCQRPKKLNDLSEDSVKASFPTGSVALRVMAKLQVKKQKANTARRFRRTRGR